MTTPAAQRPFLSVNNLSVAFPTEDGLVRAVDGVSFSIEKGKTLAVVGESGSGKSVTAQAIMGLINRKSAKITGEIWLDDQELVKLPESDVQSLRGDAMAMIFQDPMSSLHPFYRIGDQLIEAIQVHRSVSKKQARKEAIDMLRRVGIPAVERRVDDYPHQLSGGMRQRVMIADEPTTALDVTVQAQIMELIAGIQDEFKITVILITHDLGVVADVADEVAVMYGGRVVERAPTSVLYVRPEMPYTLGLLSSIPRMDKEMDRLDPIPGNPPSPIKLPQGCVFQPRCFYWERVADDLCKTTRPELLSTGPDHLVRCHLAPEVRRDITANVLSELAGVPS